MRAYGVKHTMKGPCVCEMFGANGKYALKRRERLKAKKEINEYKMIAKPSKPSFSKAFIAKMMKK
jgi:hypothetical protein